MKIIVIDNDSKKVIWKEEHETESEIIKAIENMKENHFNPKFFTYKIEKGVNS